MLWEMQFGLRRFELCLRIHLRLGTGFSRTWGEISLCFCQALCFVCLCGSPGRTIFYVWKPTVTEYGRGFRTAGEAPSGCQKPGQLIHKACYVYGFRQAYITMCAIILHWVTCSNATFDLGALGSREDHWHSGRTVGLCGCFQSRACGGKQTSGRNLKFITFSSRWFLPLSLPCCLILCSLMS